eukprot:SAG11_NODE_23887_length_381_cov_3.372340_1_plen_46_part_01
MVAPNSDKFSDGELMKSYEYGVASSPNSLQHQSSATLSAVPGTLTE